MSTLSKNVKEMTRKVCGNPGPMSLSHVKSKFIGPVNPKWYEPLARVLTPEEMNTLFGNYIRPLTPDLLPTLLNKECVIVSDHCIIDVQKQIDFHWEDADKHVYEDYYKRCYITGPFREEIANVETGEEYYNMGDRFMPSWHIDSRGKFRPMKYPKNDNENFYVFYCPDDGFIPQQSGGGSATKTSSSKETISHKGRKHVVHTGPRGGKYIVAKGKRVYGVPRI